MPGSPKLPECELVVVFVVKYIHQGCEERVQVLRENVRIYSQTKAWTYIEDRKLGENSAKLLVKGVLRELNFAHIEIAYTANFEVFVDYLEHCQPLDLGTLMKNVGAYSWCFSLSLGQDDVQEICRCRHWRYCF